MKKPKIVFLVLPRLHLIDLAGPVQVFHEAIGYGAEIEMEYCGPDRAASTSSEFPLGKMKSFREIRMSAGDYILIPGSEVEFLVSKEMSREKELIQWLNNAHAVGANICSICSGAFFLALTGLLDGRKATTHWKRTAELKQRFPNIKLAEDILFTEDERVYTSAGVTAGIDLALHILDKLTDDNFSFKIAREMVVYIRRNSSDPQVSIFMLHRNHVHTGIHKVQDFLLGNIEKKLSLDILAEKACMSARSLTRTFKKETGLTVNEYTTLIRISMLREFSKNTDMTRKQMARQCGLKSERQVIRLLKNLP